MRTEYSGSSAPTPAQTMAAQTTPKLVINVAAATVFRLVLNTARRFVYPFAPVFSRELAVPLTAVTSLIAVNQATAIVAVFFGPAADRWGYRLIMILGLAMLGVGMLAAGGFPLYSVILVALILAGLGKSLFDPALQAYVSEQVPFQRRGTVIGILEFAWAGSTLIGIPAVGLMMKEYGWRSPFFVMGVLGLLGIVTLTLLFPAQTRSGQGREHRVAMRTAWQQLTRQRPALGALGFAFFVSAANDNLFVIYGAWLEKSFQLSVVALGFGTTAIGAAELLGELLTATLADRIGLKRSVVGGLILCILSYAVLPLLGQSLPSALTGLWLIFLTFEFTIVCSLSLCTELLPGSRATMMAGFFAAAGAGRVVGAFSGGAVWLVGGILSTALASAALSLLGLLALLWGLHRWHAR
jgi:predicted MFS family arabinose efflux permease